MGLWTFYLNRPEYKTARKLAEQLFSLAQSVQDPALGCTLFWFGELVPARAHLERCIALYDPQKHSSRALGDPRVVGLSYAVFTLWLLGYPDQALKRSHEAITLAQELSHPFSLAWALNYAVGVHLFRREGQVTQERAEALIALCSEQGFVHWLAVGTIRRGWALAEQGRGEEGIAQIRQGLVAYQAIGSELGRSHWLALLAEAYEKVGQAEEGLTVLAEALAVVDKNGERMWEAEIYRLKGELLLKIEDRRSKIEDGDPQSSILFPRRRNVFGRLSMLPAARVQSLWSCGR